MKCTGVNPVDGGGGGLNYCGLFPILTGTSLDGFTPRQNIKLYSTQTDVYN